MAVTISLNDRKSIRFFTNVAIPNTEAEILIIVDENISANKLFMDASELIGIFINLSAKKIIKIIGINIKKLNVKFAIIVDEKYLSASIFLFCTSETVTKRLAIELIALVRIII
jgi:hypothetical protein